MMDSGRVAAYANIGSFVLGCFAVYGYFHPVAAVAVPASGQPSVNIPPLMWLFLSGLFLAGVMHVVAAFLTRSAKAPKLVSSPQGEAPQLRGERYRPLAPSDLFELVDYKAEPQQPAVPVLKWRRKLRVVLRNTAGKRVTAAAPDWVASNGYVPFQAEHEFWSLLQPEDKSAGGWMNDKFGEGKDSLVLAAGEVFRAGVGLDEGFSPEEINGRRATKRVGLLIIPVTIDGREMEWRVRL